MKILFVAFCCLLPTLCAAASGAVHLLEAEDFTPESGSQWRVIEYGKNYFVDAIGNGYISGEKLLSAPEHCPPSSASLTTEIAQPGTYRVWVHFEAPKDYNVRFGLRVEQYGAVVLDTPMGGADQTKLWPLNWGYAKQINPSYGGGDNVAWQGAELPLNAGRARFTLYTLDNPEPAAKRNIDLIYLTSDTSDEPQNRMDPFLDELPQSGRLWVRVRNGGKTPLKPSLGSFHINRRDWNLRETGIDPSFGVVDPGSVSEWKDIGRGIDTIHGTTISLNSDTKDLEAQVELAHRPDGKNIWSRQWKADQCPLYIWIPVSLDFTQTLTSDEIQAKISGYIQDLPTGKAPTKIRFAAAVPGPGEPRDGLHSRWLDLFYRLGYASPMTSPDRTEDELFGLLGSDSSRRAIGVTHTDPKTDPPKLREELSSTRYSGARRYVDVFSIGDEINLNAYSDTSNSGFVEYLQAKGLTLTDIGIQSWQEARPATPGQNPVLYVEAREYAAQTAIRRMASLTKAVREAMSDRVFVAANYAPHPYFLPEESQWIDVFKYGSLTMPWSEDYQWQVPVVSPQIIGFSLDVMRCAAKYRDLPLTYYCMPHSPGNTSADFRRSNYLALGRGVKIVNHFSLGPQMFATENYIDWRDRDRWRELYRVIHEAGEVDDLLFAGKAPHAEVAVLLSRYSDLWEKVGNSDANLYGVERQNLWLALKHLQIPVDLITDSDVEDGVLSGYKVLYISGPNLSRGSAAQIERWVSGGGVLFSSAGGGLFDEYNRPLDTLLPVYGLRSHELTRSGQDSVVRVKMELPRMKPLEMLRFDGEKPFSMPALGVVETLQPASSAQAIAFFSEGQPAAVSNMYGKGRAYLIGSMPGLTYVRAAIPRRPFDRNEFAHFLPKAFDVPVRALIGRPVQDAGVQPTIWCSNALVEGDALVSSAGEVISLVNFTDKPIRSLKVRVSTSHKPSKVWSVRSGALSYRYAQGVVEVALPLEVTDFLVVQ
ncbi:MAG: beta-galactosidase trimerization domain-containing protein [Armatimonadetes bacterium]|nr:beta-galactosidase trimerization domain-containing protein [Armatimonadota bacterium]